MSLISKLLRRQPTGPQGPLYGAVKSAMADVQAYARSHGGEIELVSVNDEGDVLLRLHGSCRGCPLSSVTLKLGVERHLRELVPGVRKIEAG